MTIVICVSVFWACEQGGSGTTDDTKLLQTDRMFSKLSVDSGAAYAFHKYLAADAIMLPAGRNPVFGLDSIYASMINNEMIYTLEWDPQRAEIANSGELGWTWGKYKMSYKDKDGILVNSYGKYLNIWRLDVSGNWKVMVDMGNKSPDKE